VQNAGSPRDRVRRDFIRYILRFILQKQPVSQFATGFVRGKGIVHNARLHAGVAFLLNVDLEDFFGSVTVHMNPPKIKAIRRACNKMFNRELLGFAGFVQDGVAAHTSHKSPTVM